ncbi:hypothetical protein SR39_18200 [Methylobacterium radiotolerans]|jgi:hypothetical protein|nr:hypothetical protein SR39_18200 [Methylobacterium radiotolerans]
MRPNSPQRRHHYIPEFYLKRWQLGGDRLLEFSRPRGSEVRYRWVSPKQTGYVNKLYFLEHLPAELQNDYEDRFFTPVDTKAARVLERFEARDFNLDTVARSSWARFIMSLTFRAPEMIEGLRQHLTHDLFHPSPQREAAYRRRRQSGQPETLLEALELERNDGDIEHYTLDVAMGLADSRKIGQRLINMAWGYRVLPFNAPALLTSDRPTVWAQSLDDPQFRIFFPIGPKTVFWAANSPRTARAIQNADGETLAKALNENLVRRAVRYVWGTSTRQHDFVQRCMGVNPPHTIPDTLIQQRWDLTRERQRNRIRKAKD